MNASINIEWQPFHYILSTISLPTYPSFPFPFPSFKSICFDSHTLPAFPHPGTVLFQAHSPTHSLTHAHNLSLPHPWVVLSKVQAGCVYLLVSTVSTVLHKAEERVWKSGLESLALLFGVCLFICLSIDLGATSRLGGRCNR